MRRIVFVLALIAGITGGELRAQYPGGGGAARGKGGAAQMNAGRFYGKIVDAANGKPVDAASVQLFQTKFDSTSKTRKDVIIGGQLTRANGDFSLENLPVMGNFKLVISAIGFKAIEQKVGFDIKPGGNPQDMMAALDKDLGNIKLASEAQALEGVTVVASKPTLEMAIDRKVFNVEKNLMSTGGTAQDVLRTVPSVSVDIDGNVSMRNSSPQIFVDGRPSTLTIDQIPADAIQSIELITNPSAKYDASGGMAGIINIVMKKNRKVGYNGSVRVGIDKRGRINTGGDLNVRQGKVNVFASGNYNQRKSISNGTTDRSEFFNSSLKEITQQNKAENTGYFASGKLGLDYFLDNRNTITFTQSITRGVFDSEDNLNIQNTYPNQTGLNYNSTQLSLGDRSFRNLGSSLAYKHLFAKTGKEITADVNYNSSKNNNDGNFTTNLSNNPKTILQKQDGSGKSSFFTAQTDFVNPLGENNKIEMGARIAVRDYSSINNNFIDTTGQYEIIANASNKYKYTDKVYAAYVTYSGQVRKIGYQIGLRAESSDYDGTLLTTKESFSNNYPLSLFPSAFLTYKLSDNEDIQLNYTRRVNRPNFFQIIPYTDYADSNNISRGNPGLKPEFTHSLELSYQNAFSRQHNFLASLYFKNTTDLITRFQFKEFSDVADKEVLINSYENANQSYNYGIELTSRNSFVKWFELTSNLNVYNSIIEGGNIEAGLRNEQFSYYAKVNSNFKLPSNYSIQLTGEYQSKTAIPVNTGGRGGGGGWGSQASTTQGYIRPNYGVDIAFKKEFLKNNAASVTLSFSDIFRTRLYDAYSESPLFTQNITRRRDPQFVRLSFSYRFGKFDANLFKRKNNRGGNEGMDMQQM